MSEPSVSLVTILDNWYQFNILMEHHWNAFDYPKDKLEWIIVDDSIDDHSSSIPPDENILYFHVKSEEYIDKIEFKKDNEQTIQNYFKLSSRLPNGFKRDYAVGMTSNDYIFHLDIDTIYNPKVIRRKLRFLKENKLECCYCKAMLAYDIYGKQLYKVENNIGGYESTLFHTKDFWKKGGFHWEDIVSEAISFYYGKGLDRPMENFYDTIKLLSIHNHTNYQPKKIELENMDIQIPEVVNTLNVSQHPLQIELSSIFRDSVNVIGIQSELIHQIKTDQWICENIEEDTKLKEKNLIKKINSFGKSFDICFLNTKNPIWSIFKTIRFNCIFLETSKNRDQMDHILKQNNFIVFDNLYLHKDFLQQKITDP
uniref:Glycosyltransferase 2-like domain-containing protein n=1 Tax=viral metagenome TaxID=1070528 RepID=A0A6C0L2V0_9ZZZZ|tara:strand:+ start:34062 stop:35168 length:1107 start_codon:yes stop_codon:yes gene_type:complete